jgi:hypothetical protein
VGGKQGEIVRGEGGKKSVANMRMLHGRHFITLAIARRYADLRGARGRKRSGPRLLRSTRKCGNPRSRRTTPRSRDRDSRYGC